jgi:hypothetical protein
MAGGGVLLDPIGAEQRQDHVGYHTFAGSIGPAPTTKTLVSENIWKLSDVHWRAYTERHDTAEGAGSKV